MIDTKLKLIIAIAVLFIASISGYMFSVHLEQLRQAEILRVEQQRQMEEQARLLAEQTRLLEIQTRLAEEQDARRLEEEEQVRRMTQNTLDWSPVEIPRSIWGW